MKGTTCFLCKLGIINSVQDNTYLVSSDIKSWYTSISNAEGIKAVKESFDKHASKNVVTKVIATFLARTLTLYNFVFNCKHYLQIKGCTMEMICSSSDTNIFVDHFDRGICIYIIYIYIYPFLRELSLIYLRFINEIFFLWTGTKEKLTNCLNNLNKNTIPPSLNMKYGKLASHFLIQKSLLRITNF